jgi:hypothetical protein
LFHFKANFFHYLGVLHDPELTRSSMEGFTQSVTINPWLFEPIVSPEFQAQTLGVLSLGVLTSNKCH